jgi:protein-S-isoprenylcysteine O-methyltransferase Ste14
MPRYRFPKPYSDFAARFRVPCGFVLVAAFLWLSAPSVVSLLYGLPVAFLGIWLRAWAAGHVAKDQRLATGGPYACVRNPLYLGTLVAAAGLVLAAHSIPLALLFAAAFLLMYLPVIELEEQHLRSLFPEYAEYAARVPMLLPRFQSSPEGQRFAWRQWVRNREYQGLAGFLAGAAVLVGKALL